MKRPLPPFVLRPVKKPVTAKSAHLDDRTDLKPKRRPLQMVDRLAPPTLKVIGRVHDELIRIRL